MSNRHLERLVGLWHRAQIALCPAFLATLLGAVLCSVLDTTPLTAWITCMALAGIGLVLGILWAVRVQRRGGATAFMARVEATPELDVTANLRALETGEPDHVRRALRFLAELGPAARRALPDVEELCAHEDPEIARLARLARAAICR